MSTITMSTAPVRQPFGSVSDARLRKLTSLKNKQNALASTPATALKRQAPTDFDEPDTENIDPRHFFSSDSSKKAKTFDFTLSKPPRYSLNLTPANTPVKCSTPSHHHLNTSTKRKATTTTTTTNPLLTSPPTHHPSSAPAHSHTTTTAAGRSPKHKRIGILSKRRHTTRIDPPPSFPSSTTNTPPLSLAAALHGSITLPSKTKKSSHHFTIHEDTPEEEMSNLMQHSTQTLDISSCDDDDAVDGTPAKRKGRGDRCNKENVPPADYTTATPFPSSAGNGNGGTASIRRADMMTEDIRAPLADLVAEEYWAEGCGAGDAFVVVDDEDENETVVPGGVSPLATTTTVATVAPAELGGKEGSALRAEILPTTATADQQEGNGEKPPFQIWESMSAKDEGDEVGVIGVDVGVV